jgi:hypothetical protein
MVILEEAVRDRGRMSPVEVLGMVRSLGVKTGDDSKEIIRTSRDGR